MKVGHLGQTINGWNISAILWLHWKALHLLKWYLHRRSTKVLFHPSFMSHWNMRAVYTFPLFAISEIKMLHVSIEMNWSFGLLKCGISDWPYVPNKLLLNGKATYPVIHNVSRSIYTEQQIQFRLFFLIWGYVIPTLLFNMHSIVSFLSVGLFVNYATIYICS